MDRVTRSFGRMMGDNLGSRASGVNQESPGLGAGMGDRQDPQSLSVREVVERNSIRMKEFPKPKDHVNGR